MEHNLCKYVFRSALLLAASAFMPLAGFAASADDTAGVQATQQAKVSVSGTVSDSEGPVIGATVMEKGTQNGTVTDVNGHFSLNVASRNSVLVITAVGMTPQEVKASGNLNITMKSDDQLLNEVVVVGYGAQKKVDMTGSVSAINMNDIAEKRPINNVSQALAGLAAGVTVLSNSNAPGADNAYIRVRGQGTLNDATALVIVDGVEQGIGTVNPQDIESISILKDAASSAIYGSRAANGVILITTKQGKAGKMQVNYNGYLSFESIRKTLTPVSNYADYMELINEGYANSKLGAVFSQESIDAWRNGNDPLKYPNTDWIDETFQNTIARNHVVSMSGGTDKIHFYASLGYNHNPGVMYNSGYKKYSGRVNLDADIKPWLNLAFQLSGYVSDRDPGYANISNVFTYASATTPGMVFRAPDGRFGAMNNEEDDAQSATNNPLIRMYSRTGKNRTNQFRPRFVATLKPFKGFTLTGSYTYDFVDTEVTGKPVWIDGWNFLTEQKTWTNQGRTSFSDSDSKGERYFNDLVARYENKAFKDRLSYAGMIGVSNELYRSHGFSGSRQDMIDLSMDVLNGATGDMSVAGTKTEWSMRSFFGRVNLNWDEKYLFEFNLRTDGSSRFADGRRWGWFPSASFGWRIDQEKFMQNALNGQLSALKLRLSYGSLGNNAVGNYDSQALYTSSNGGNNYVLGNNMITGMAQVAIANSRLTWETTKVFDVGLDFGFFNNRLNGTVDYFNKRTEDILINLPAPAVHGTASIPKENAATVVNNGFEITLNWQDHINDFHYGVTGNFSYVKNKVTKFKGKDEGGMSISGSNLVWEGHSINSQYLLHAVKILQTDEDMQLVQQMIDNAPTDANGKKQNPFAAFGTPQKGDLLYADLNGDGVVDNNDKYIASDGPTPKYTMGLTLNAAWKGFDFSCLMQGVFGVKVYWQHAAYNTPTVRFGYQLNKKVVDGRWYEGRTDATYPRLLQYSDTRNTQLSDFYLENKAFFKIRNIQLGYTIPKSLTEYARIERLRVYCGLENFFTFTSYNGFDPEVSGMNYPSMKQVTLGVNLTF